MKPACEETETNPTDYYCIILILSVCGGGVLGGELFVNVGLLVKNNID